MYLSAIIPTLGALIFVVGALAWVLRRWAAPRRDLGRATSR